MTEIPDGSRTHSSKASLVRTDTFLMGYMVDRKYLLFL
jgi:hypothetical protein